MYLATAAKGLYAFHAATGARIWHHPVTGGSSDVWASSMVVGDRFFATRSGTLLACAL